MWSLARTFPADTCGRGHTVLELVLPLQEETQSDSTVRHFLLEARWSPTSSFSSQNLSVLLHFLWGSGSSQPKAPRR